MSQRTDVGWWLFGTDNPPSNLISPVFANGVLSATTGPGGGARLFLLESGLAPSPGGGATPAGKTGQQFPINASKYTHLLYRMSAPLGFNDTGDPNMVSQFIWSTNTIYQDQTLGVNKQVIKGAAIYDVNLAALTTVNLLNGPTPWSGTKRALQFLPTNGASQAIQLDWVRLVDESDATLLKTITWTGGSAVDVYLDNDNVAGNGNLGRIAINTSAKSLNFYVGGLAPGDYFVAVGPHTDNQMTTGLSYSPGFYRVNSIPTLQFTTPSDEGSDEDFAATRLGNAWDFHSAGDIDFRANIVSEAFTAIPLTSEAGVNLGSQTVYLATSAAASETAGSGGFGDPFVFPMFWDKRGKVTQIDPTRYRIVTIEAGVPNMARSLPGGSIGRVVWRFKNEPTIGGDGLPGQTVGEHYELNSAVGENTVSRITVDMKDWPVSPGTPAQTRWLNGGPVDAFRFDPHEFAPRTNFFIKRIKLAALERTIGNTLTFRWTYSEPSGTVSLFRQPAGTAKNFSGGNTIVSNTSAVAGSFTWDTTGVPDGEYQIYATFTDGTNANQVYAPTNIVVDHANDAVARINLNRTQLSYSITGAAGGGIVQTDPQSVSLTFTGAGSQCWTASSSNGFVTVSPASGNASARLTIQTTPGANFPGGRTDAVVTIQSCTNPANARAIGIAVNVFNFGAPPTGSMDTPAENSVARGAIPVTGWASDDVQVTRVMICRAPVAGDAPGACPNGTVFIGDATFVDDARPDIEQNNPTNPLNYRGGWGLMMLTNFLPNQGNGAITLFAYAVDRDGHVVQIGTRHISTQNITATVPFGTIDSPKAGEIVCGTQFPNAGWALTQRPKTISAPTQITVFVDGVAIGHPIAGGPRSDITGLFSPTYDTSTASTVFGLDTTRFSNGPHTLFWIVSDSSGAADGIGSRFFTISNPCGS